MLTGIQPGSLLLSSPHNFNRLVAYYASCPVTDYFPHGYGNWAIVLQASAERIIGFAGISVRTLNGSLTNNLGYRFSTATWGGGIATEFCQFALTQGFETPGLQEITAVVRPDHLASRRVNICKGKTIGLLLLV